MMKTKGVSFNLEDPQQRGLYEHTQRYKNFSAYVKHLITVDKEKEGRISAPQVTKSEVGGYQIKF